MKKVLFIIAVFALGAWVGHNWNFVKVEGNRVLVQAAK